MMRTRSRPGRRSPDHEAGEEEWRRSATSTGSVLHADGGPSPEDQRWRRGRPPRPGAQRRGRGGRPQSAREDERLPERVFHQRPGPGQDDRRDLVPAAPEAQPSTPKPIIRRRRTLRRGCRPTTQKSRIRGRAGCTACRGAAPERQQRQVQDEQEDVANVHRRDRAPGDLGRSEQHGPVWSPCTMRAPSRIATALAGSRASAWG